jgi:hypothetical protein
MDAGMVASTAQLNTTWLSRLRSGAYRAKATGRPSPAR